MQRLSSPLSERLSRHRGAFTLVELLVVISIVGVLLALLMPALSNARETAMRTRCASNLRQVMISLTSYDVSYRNYPTGHNGKGNAFYDWTSGTPAYVTLRDEYAMAESILNCPSLVATPIMTRSNGGNYSKDTSSVIYLGYMYLAGYGGRNQTAPGSFNDVNGWLAGTFPARNYGYIPATSEVTTGCKTFGGEISLKQTLPPSRQFIANDYGYSVTTNPNIRWAKQSAHPGPDGFACAGENVLFQDGHVKWSNLEVGKSWWIASNLLFSNEDDQPPGTLLVN